MIRARTLSFLFAIMLAAEAVCLAQGVGNGGNGGGNNQGNSSGIRIDAQGVVSLAVASDSTGGLDRKRRETARNDLPRDISRKSSLRMVSLVKLEQQLVERLSRDQEIPRELFYLAGLQRIEHVFVFPDEQDLIIAGPAEGFVPDAVGRMVGIESGRPTLRLDDFYVALRVAAQSKPIGCSIDPVPQRLADLQRFIRQGGPAAADEVEARFNQMDEILGLQDVRIDGVPADSHFATMLVEADYRMKRISMGQENPAIKGLKSHLTMLGTGGNTMQRWWFVPFYEAIYRSDDGLAFQFVGQRAQLMAEEEVADASGTRSGAATTKKSTHAFAERFTEKFAQLADKSPVFGELQNLIDWAVFVALLKKEQIPERIGWKHELLMDDQRLAYPVFDTPKKIPSQVSYKRTANMIVGLVGGGVTIDPWRAVGKATAAARDSAALMSIRASVLAAPKSVSHGWWRDAAREPNAR
jgi:hypothetical protein